MQDRVEYFVGACVPDSCTESEVQTLVVYGKWNYPTVIKPLHCPCVIYFESKNDKSTAVLNNICVGCTGCTPVYICVCVCRGFWAETNLFASAAAFNPNVGFHTWCIHDSMPQWFPSCRPVCHSLLVSNTHIHFWCLFCIVVLVELWHPIIRFLTDTVRFWFVICWY